MKQNIWNFSEVDLKLWLETAGFPRFRYSQIMEWVFKKQILSPALWTNLPKDLKTKLLEAFDWDLPETITRHDSEDLSTKLLLGGRDGRSKIETVIMRYDKRTSLCVSSQVGCRLACQFCQTGKLGFMRHLSCGEILDQVFIANKILGPEGRRVSHVVFMGMGEPLDNYSNVILAANTLLNQEVGFGLSARHVTISTSGIASRIAQLADDCRASLAVSLHAGDEALRSSLMPINKKYPLTLLKKELLAYQAKTGRKLTFEYILIAGVNTSEQAARSLVRFLSGFSAKVNLIPFNSHPGLPFKQPSEDEIRHFQRYLSTRSIPAPVRYSRALRFQRPVDS